MMSRPLDHCPPLGLPGRDILVGRCWHHRTVVAGKAAFDPQELTADASLNRVVIADLDGVSLGVAGRRAGELCSRDGLLELARRRGVGGVNSVGLADHMGALVSSGSRRSRTAAEQVLTEFGTRLAALIATLLRPETAERQGDTPTRRAYLEHWQRIRQVWLAGGLLIPTTSPPILAGARAALQAMVVGCDLDVATHGPLAPLLGAARMTTGARPALVADLGHTTMKTAFPAVENGRLTKLAIGPSVPAPGGDPAAFDAVQLERAVISILAEAARSVEAEPTQPVEIVVSVAAYVARGQPANDRRGIYTKLGASPERVLAAVRDAAGRAVTIRYVHDGTASAAATGHPGVSAVMTIGSWLGIGFTPVTLPLLDLDEVFTISHDGASSKL